MNTYLGFAYSGSETPSEDAFADGENLAANCYKQLRGFGEPSQFPPRLLVLLASSRYLQNNRANDLVSGIVTFFTSHFEEPVPLIGSSVAAVLFERQSHECGAVLVCLASKFLTAQVGAAAEISTDQSSIANLAKGLGLRHQNPGTQGRPKLLLFLPGQIEGYPPKLLYKSMSMAVGYRVPITGGVSHPVSTDQDSGLQFTQFGVHRGAVVAARLDLEAAAASRLRQSLTRAEPEKYATVSSPLHIRLDDSTSLEELTNKNGFALLGRVTEDHPTPVVVISRSGVKALAAFKDGEKLQLLAADPGRIDQKARFSVSEPIGFIEMSNPVGSIVFDCASYYRFRDDIGLHFQDELRGMEEEIGNAPIVGGFFDGEIGVDPAGRSMLTNWSGATLTFSDQMLEQALWQHGFQAIAGNNERLNNAQSVHEVISISLDMVCKAGYPGALISLLLSDAKEDWIIAQGTSGRFDATRDLIQCRWADEKELAQIERDEKLRYKRDCRSSRGNGQPVWQQGLISQYVLPLYGGPSVSPDSSAGRILLGFLHIDLGDSSKRREIPEIEKQVLNSLGVAVESSLFRVLSLEEARIMRALDLGVGQALQTNSVHAGRQIFLEVTVEAFGGVSGYIRILHGHTLEMVAREGNYADAIYKKRPEIDSTDQSLCGQAFVRGESRPINNPSRDAVLLHFCNRYEGAADQEEETRQMVTAVKSAGSFLVAILKDALARKVGTILIVAKKPWSFHKYHMRCLEAAGERLRSLIDHLEKTERANFLLQIGADLPAAAHFPDLGTALKAVVLNFRNVSQAQIVSLFLWDESFGKFVLRAQSGWREEGWEFAAYYEKHEDWTGSVAMEDEPRYAEDMIEQREEMGAPLQGVYEREMFGGRNAQRIAGIGLPLKAGEKRLGVLTAFRWYDPSAKGEAFVTTDQEVLAQAADRIAGYVSILLLQRSERLEKERSERLDGLYRAMLAADEAKLVDTLCQTLSVMYKARKVLLYAPKEEGGWLECVAPSNGKQPPDDLVVRVSHDLHMDATPKPSREEERHDRSAAAHGVLLRACIPLSVKAELLGVLDIHWPDDLTRAEQFVRKDELQFLAAMARSVYHRHKLTKALREANKNVEDLQAKREYKADAMIAPAKQALHRSKNINLLLERLEKAIPKEDQDSVLSRIREIKFITHQLPRAMEFLKAGLNPIRSIEGVGSLVEEAVSEFQWGKNTKYVLTVTPGLEVNVNRAWIVEAFFNIIDNGIHAIHDKGEPGTITISAITVGEKVRVVFKDTGIGMTKEEVEMVLKGSHGRRRLHRTGVGVPLTRILLVEQGGDLSIDSQKGFGTEVVVELPLANRRMDHETASIIKTTAPGGRASDNSQTTTQNRTGGDNSDFDRRESGLPA